jgi:hypothetical protein
MRNFKCLLFSAIQKYFLAIVFVGIAFVFLKQVYVLKLHFKVQFVSLVLYGSGLEAETRTETNK